MNSKNGQIDEGGKPSEEDSRRLNENKERKKRKKRRRYKNVPEKKRRTCNWPVGFETMGDVEEPSYEISVSDTESSMVLSTDGNIPEPSEYLQVPEQSDVSEAVFSSEEEESSFCLKKPKCLLKVNIPSYRAVRKKEEEKLCVEEQPKPNPPLELPQSVFIPRPSPPSTPVSPSCIPSVPPTPPSTPYTFLKTDFYSSEYLAQITAVDQDCIEEEFVPYEPTITDSDDERSSENIECTQVLKKMTPEAQKRLTKETAAKFGLSEDEILLNLHQEELFAKGLPKHQPNTGIRTQREHTTVMKTVVLSEKTHTVTSELSPQKGSSPQKEESPHKFSQPPKIKSIGNLSGARAQPSNIPSMKNFAEPQLPSSRELGTKDILQTLSENEIILNLYQEQLYGLYNEPSLPGTSDPSPHKFSEPIKIGSICNSSSASAQPRNTPAMRNSQRYFSEPRPSNINQLDAHDIPQTLTEDESIMSLWEECLAEIGLSDPIIQSEGEELIADEKASTHSGSTFSVSEYKATPMEIYNQPRPTETSDQSPQKAATLHHYSGPLRVRSIRELTSAPSTSKQLGTQNIPQIPMDAPKNICRQNIKIPKAFKQPLNLPFTKLDTSSKICPTRGKPSSSIAPLDLRPSNKIETKSPVTSVKNIIVSPEFRALAEGKRKTVTFTADEFKNIVKRIEENTKKKLNIIAIIRPDTNAARAENRPSNKHGDLPQTIAQKFENSKCGTTNISSKQKLENKKKQKVKTKENAQNIINTQDIYSASSVQNVVNVHVQNVVNAPTPLGVYDPNYTTKVESGVTFEEYGTGSLSKEIHIDILRTGKELSEKNVAESQLLQEFEVPSIGSEVLIEEEVFVFKIPEAPKRKRGRKTSIKGGVHDLGKPEIPVKWKKIVEESSDIEIPKTAQKKEIYIQGMELQGEAGETQCILDMQSNDQSRVDMPEKGVKKKHKKKTRKKIDIRDLKMRK